MLRADPRHRGAAVAVLLVAAVGLGGCDTGASTAPPSGEPPSREPQSRTTTADEPTAGTPDSGAPESATPATAATHRYPDVVAVEVTAGNEPGTWDVAATISSPYDTPERYADAFRVLAPDGTELGVRELLHDHAGEQPFTRSLVGLAVPADVERITVEGRDLDNGWGGATTSVDLPG
jgi:hypothetical protein